MRINLLTPFAEKDAVKALGARWDAAKKVWYITDIADLSPFARWIPDLAATSSPAPSPVARKAQGVTTRPSIELAPCGCNVLPWVDCEHTQTD